ncbi:MYB DOMAIN PROTEIN 5 ISOFORM 1 [Salix viminalis]|nr:MYB DOMAIN PROTEIN 5 ISOFORM 1 [Salix viminalis]
MKTVSSGLEETTSDSTPIANNKENEYFQNDINAHLDVQHLANHFIASQGYTGLLTYDGASGMDLRGNQRLGIGEADDQDINSGTDDVFSFLNSLINEEAFQQHQILNVPHVNSTAPSSSDPFVSSTFGLGMTGWESPLMSSALNQNDSK